MFAPFSRKLNAGGGEFTLWVKDGLRVILKHESRLLVAGVLEEPFLVLQHPTTADTPPLRAA